MAISVSSVFGYLSPLGKVVWSEKITDDLLKAFGLPTNATTVDLIVKVSDPFSVTDDNNYGIAYADSKLILVEPGVYRDGNTYAFRGIPVKKGDTLFIAGNHTSAGVHVSVERPGAPLPKDAVPESPTDKFAKGLGESIGTGTILLIGAILLIVSAKKAATNLVT